MSSCFELYSFGIVLKNIVPGDVYISVNPVEKLSFSTGAKKKTVVKNGKVEYERDASSQLLADAKTEYDVTAPDHQGVTSNFKVTGTEGIMAKWVGDGTNRQTPPDVCAGETVHIYRNSDTDEYFWSCFMREPSIRRQETVCYMFSNLKDGVKAFDKDTSYWFEVSTRDKYLKLHTSNNDGEPVIIDVTINAAEGYVSLNDDSGVNSFKVDFKNGELKSSMREAIDFSAKRISLNAQEELKFTGPSLNNESDATVNKGSMDTKGKTTCTGGMSSKKPEGSNVSAEFEGNITGDANAHFETVDAVNIRATTLHGNWQG